MDHVIDGFGQICGDRSQIIMESFNFPQKMQGTILIRHELRIGIIQYTILLVGLKLRNLAKLLQDIFFVC